MKSTRSIRALEAALVACLSVGTGQAAAYTVRPPQLRSYLGQPLRLLVHVDLDAGERQPDEIKLASEDDFRRLGLDPLILHSASLQVRTEPQAGGLDVYIESRAGVSEPLFALLLEIRRGNLRTLHQFNVLLDPVTADTGSAPLKPAVATPADVRATSPAPAAARRARLATAAQGAPAWSPGGTYGPVRRNESLSEIALKVRADRQVSIPALVAALVALNPQATHGRPDFVAEGAVLQLPRELTRREQTPADAVARAPSAAVASTPAPIPAPAPVAAAAAPAAAEPAVAAPANAAAVEGGANAPVTRFQLATSLGQTAQPETVSEAAVQAPSNDVAAPPPNAQPAQPVATGPSASMVAAQPHPPAGRSAPARSAGWLAALLAMASALLLAWARRSERGERGGEARVVTPEPPSESVAAPEAVDFDLGQLEPKPAPLSPEERVVLLKQAYAARGKRYRDVGNG